MDDGVATLRSEGQVNPDIGKATLMGMKIRAWLAGKESGIGRFDIGTGMPEEITDSVNIEGPAVLDGGEGRIGFFKKLRMVGGRVGR